MRILLAVDHATQTVHAEAAGPITREDVERHLTSEERAAGIAYREVIDTTRATAVFDGADARSLMETIRGLAARGAFGPTAVIVANDVTYGMVRMLETLLDDIADVRPFRSNERQQAEEWVRAAPVRPKRSS